MRVSDANTVQAINTNGRCDLEVADIFRRYGEQYRSLHKLTPKQHGVMFDIEHCRTHHFGYHMDVCDACGWKDQSHNSCRNRHCPKCQGIASRKWVTAREANLLPVPYHHSIFTLPHVINPLVPFNKELLYDFIFDSAAESLLQFGRDPKWLGAEIGFYGILHSWGGKLWSHLHIHFIVPAGGIDSQGRWVEPRYKGKFLFPVQALSLVFRGKFIEKLKHAYDQGLLIFPDSHRHLTDSGRFENYVNALVGRNWNVHVKPSFATPEKVVRYIGRYTHRIAISNNRLIKLENDRVHFKFKNYRNNGCWEETSLTAMDFIGRFLMHVLPEGFHKIRHYGFLANGRCKIMVEKIRRQLVQDPSSEPEKIEHSGHPCPECGNGIMRVFLTVTRYFTTFHPAWRMVHMRPQAGSS